MIEFKCFASLGFLIQFQTIYILNLKFGCKSGEGGRGGGQGVGFIYIYKLTTATHKGYYAVHYKTNQYRFRAEPII